MRLDEVGERALVARITARLAASGGPRRNAAGFSDDAAAVPFAGGHLVATTDMVAASTHFPPQATPEDMGWMLGAVNLSDLAAMGAEPLGLLASLGLPPETDLAVVDGIVAGLAEVCAAHGCEVLGGDTKPNPALTLAATALGTTPRPLLRRDARPGHLLAVTGPLGGADAALRRLLAGAPREAGLRLLRPVPRVAEGIALREAGASAAVDLSDGLALSVHLLAHAAGCGAVLDSDAVPRADGADLPAALEGGGDYELLAALPPDAEAAARRAVPGLAVVGRLMPRGVTFASGAPLPRAGWEHFRRQAKP